MDDMDDTDDTATSACHPACLPRNEPIDTIRMTSPRFASRSDETDERDGGRGDDDDGAGTDDDDGGKRTRGGMNDDDGARGSEAAR